MYIVDSFGSMGRETFKRLFYLFTNNVRTDIRIGYHSHNNLQLAYSNAMDLVELARKREVILDSSVFGMGRGAGNLNTELLAGYLNERFTPRYQIAPLLEAIDCHLDAIHKETPWGYSVAHFLSASLNCHPNYATYLLGKKNLSVQSIRDLLARLAPDQRQRFSQDIIDALYEEFRAGQHVQANIDASPLPEGDVCVLAPGPSAKLQHGEIQEHVERQGLRVIAVNHVLEQGRVDFAFFSNQKRYDRFIDQIDPATLIATSNLSLHARHQRARVADFGELVNVTTCRSDNASILLLNLLRSLGHQQVTVAGLDGYDVAAAENYSYREPGGVLDAETMRRDNESVQAALTEVATTCRLRFLTPSRFLVALPVRACGVIPARYKSSRFEGKPLAMIAGVPMLERTYRQAQKAAFLDRVLVATDDERIRQFCDDAGLEVTMTSESCLTGTDRLAEVAGRFEYDLFVNIQGDEPVISPEAIDQVVSAYRQHRDEFLAYNLYKRIDAAGAAARDTIIKVIIDENEELVYMSRLPVPFSKSGESPAFYKQVCVYGFTPEALEMFASHPKTCNERFEDIEILRFVDLGCRVKMIETSYDSIAVDVPEDIKLVEDWLASGEHG